MWHSILQTASSITMKQFHLSRALALCSIIYLTCLDGNASAAPPLPTLGASATELTVSGLSSGAYMAVQYEIAHSAMVKGAGILAGGPYLVRSE